MTTFVRRFRRALPNNFVEWVLSILILCIGILWLLFPMSFARQDMEPFLELWPARVWTTAAIMIGLLSCVGVASHTEAPKLAGTIRFLMGGSRVIMFFAFTGRSFAASDPVSVSLGVLAWSAFAILDLRNVARAAAETINAFRNVHSARLYPMVR